METLLKQELKPTRLEIEDFSARHAGHAGANPEGESHFRVTIESEAFRGLPRIARHQMVYRILAQELQNGLHALVLETRYIGE